MAYKPDDDDIFIITYARCGTTWTMCMAGLLVHKGDVSHITSQTIYLDVAGEAVRATPRPRVLKTHLYYDHLTHSKKAKYIYVVRNPKDALVSYYHLTKGMAKYEFADGDFDKYFEVWLKGEVDCGSYYDFNKSWVPHIHEPNVLFMKYEDMLLDHEGTVKKMGAFIGGSALESIKDPEILKKIVEESKFENMKKDEDKWFPKHLKHADTKEAYFRQGKAKSWVGRLTPEQEAAIEKKYKDTFKGTEAEKWYF